MLSWSKNCTTINNKRFLRALRHFLVSALSGWELKVGRGLGCVNLTKAFKISALIFRSVTQCREKIRFQLTGGEILVQCVFLLVFDCFLFSG